MIDKQLDYGQPRSPCYLTAVTQRNAYIGGKNSQILLYFSTQLEYKMCLKTAVRMQDRRLYPLQSIFPERREISVMTDGPVERRHVTV